MYQFDPLFSLLDLRTGHWYVETRSRIRKKSCHLFCIGLCINKIKKGEASKSKDNKRKRERYEENERKEIEIKPYVTSYGETFKVLW